VTNPNIDGDLYSPLRHLLLCKKHIFDQFSINAPGKQAKSIRYNPSFYALRRPKMSSIKKEKIRKPLTRVFIFNLE